MMTGHDTRQYTTKINPNMGITEARTVTITFIYPFSYLEYEAGLNIDILALLLKLKADHNYPNYIPVDMNIDTMLIVLVCHVSYYRV